MRRQMPWLGPWRAEHLLLAPWALQVLPRKADCLLVSIRPCLAHRPNPPASCKVVKATPWEPLAALVKRATTPRQPDERLLPTR